MRKVISKSAGFDWSEWSVAVRIFLNFFVMISVYGIIRPVRGSLLIADHGSSILPTLWLISGALIFFFVLAYSSLVGRYSPRRVFYATIGFFLLSLAGIAQSVEAKLSGAAIGLYLWTDVSSLILAEQLWSYTDEVFKGRSAKFYLGFVGAGGILGAVAGNWLTAQLSDHLNFSQLIYCAVASLAILFLVALSLPRLPGKKEELGELSDKHSTAIFRGLNIVFQSRYLIYLLILVHLSQILSNLIDFQFNAFVQEKFSVAAERTKYLSHFLFYMNSISLGMMVFLSPIVVRVLGLRGGLLMLPLSNIFTNLLAIQNGPSKSLDTVKLVDKSLNYSVQRATKELLYVPTSKEVKFRAKPVIDMFAYRFSEITAALIIMPLLKFFVWQELSGVLLILLTAQVVLVIALVREYKRALPKKAVEMEA